MDFDRNAITNHEFIDSRSELDNGSHVLVAWGEAFVKGELALDPAGVP
jgi:hypothetical protein